MYVKSIDEAGNISTLLSGSYAGPYSATSLKTNDFLGILNDNLFFVGLYGSDLNKSILKIPLAGGVPTRLFTYSKASPFNPNFISYFPDPQLPNGPTYLFPSRVKQSDSFIYFLGNDTTSGVSKTRLWVTDGTNAGTNFSPYNFYQSDIKLYESALCGNDLYFLGDSADYKANAPSDKELWKCTTTGNFTNLNLSSASAGCEGWLNLLNGSIYFEGDTVATMAYGSVLKLDGCGQTTAIERESEGSEGQINIFPNPSSGRFTIRFQSWSIGTCQVLSIDGKRMGEFQINGNDEVVDISGFPKGLYFLKLASGKSLKISKE